MEHTSEINKQSSCRSRAPAGQARRGGDPSGLGPRSPRALAIGGDRGGVTPGGRMVQSSARAPAGPAARERAPSPAQPLPTVEPQAQSRTEMEGVSSHRTLSYSRWSYDR